MRIVTAILVLLVATPFVSTLDVRAVSELDPTTSGEGLEAGDAPASCVDAHLITEGVWSGGLWGPDLGDVFRFAVDIGDFVSLTIAHDLEDGQNFDLSLLDPSCRIVVSTSTTRDVEHPNARGAPEASVAFGIGRSGYHYAWVRRMSGETDYGLVLVTRSPMPTLPSNDAGSGRDPTSASDAVPIAVPGAYQARFHEGDGTDWFVLTTTPSMVLRITVEPSFGSFMGLRVYDDALRIVASSPFSGGPILLEVPPTARARFLVTEQGIGGGNYAFVLAEGPADP